MKYSALILFCFIFSFAFSQVGINTTSPTKDLDINGEARVRNLPLASDFNFVTANGFGDLRKRSDFKLLVDVKKDTATGPVPFNSFTTSGFTVNNLDLELSITMTIPPNVKAIVIVEYSVPIGTLDNAYKFNGFVGVRFLKNGTETPSGSSKVTLPAQYLLSTTSSSAVQMITITKKYIDILPEASVSRNFTYSLNGYIEQAHSTSFTRFRFNMWSATGLNYNWGRAVLVGQLYIEQP